MFGWEFIISVWAAIASGIFLFAGTLSIIMVVGTGFHFILRKLSDKVYGRNQDQPV